MMNSEEFMLFNQITNICEDENFELNLKWANGYWTIQAINKDSSIYQCTHKNLTTLLKDILEELEIYISED